MLYVSLLGPAVKNECDISVAINIQTRVNQKKFRLLFLGLIYRQHFYAASQYILYC